MAEDDLRTGAKAAAAAAAVGAAVGVARAIATRAEDAAHAEDQDDDETTEQEEEPEPMPTQQSRNGAAPKKLRELTAQARAVLEELSGVDVESVSAVERLTDGWRITLEALELRRIPETTDILGTYEVELDEDGDLLRYERRRRYSRSQSDDGDRA